MRVETLFFTVTVPLLLTFTAHAFRPLLKRFISRSNKPLTNIDDAVCSLAQGWQPQVTVDEAYTEILSVLFFKDGQIIKTPLRTLKDLVTSTMFNRRGNTVIYIPGFQDKFEPNTSMAALADAYQAKRYQSNVGYNFMYYNTSINQDVESTYTKAALETQALGLALGHVLADLHGMYPDMFQSGSVHLIGHELGAHIAGEAGSLFHTRTTKKLAQITGLDPARPCFTETWHIPGLSKMDAMFVDIIRTSPRTKDNDFAKGDVDFFVGDSDLSRCSNPDCWYTNVVDLYTKSVLLAPEVIIEARKCVTDQPITKNNCNGEIIAMGFAVPKNASGNFYVDPMTYYFV